MPYYPQNIWDNAAETLEKLTSEIVNHRLKGRGIQLVSEYEGAAKKALFRCEHGHEWKALPHSVMAGHGCRECYGHKPLTPGDVNKRLRGRKIELAGVFLNVNTKARFRCASLHEWETDPNVVLRGSGCPICAGNRRLEEDEINNRLKPFGLKLVGVYESHAKAVLIECANGHQRYQLVGNAVRGKGCTVCRKAGLIPSPTLTPEPAPPVIEPDTTDAPKPHTKKLTTDIINKRLAKFGLRMIDEYENAFKKATFECAKHHQFISNANNVQSRRNCPECAKQESRKALREDFNQRLAPAGIVMLSEHSPGKNKFGTFQHSCGHVWRGNIHYILEEKVCPECKPNKKLTPAIINERLLPRGIVMLGDYVNANTNAQFECRHGHQWKAHPGGVLAGHGCPHCTHKAKLTKETVNERLAHVGIELIGEYVGVNSRSLFRCRCGHEWITKPNNLWLIKKCPACREKRPEEPEIDATEVIDAMIVMIRENAGKPVDLDDLHAAEAKIKGFIGLNGLAAYKKLLDDDRLQPSQKSVEAPKTEPQKPPQKTPPQAPATATAFKPMPLPPRTRQVERQEPRKRQVAEDEYKDERWYTIKAVVESMAKKAAIQKQRFSGCTW